MSNSPFSENYHEARERFLHAAKAAGAQHRACEVGDDLTIDFAIIGDHDANRTCIVSSGLHGVEGFLGSAIQLEQFNQANLAPRVRFVFAHALNPFGFANLRRCDQDNVDLNRNFLIEEQYAGAPKNYARFHPLLNPKRPIGRFDLFKLKAILQIARFGIPALKEAIAVGQYDFPQGLFFGGAEMTLSARLFAETISQCVADSGPIVHVDVHSGLGKYGDYKIILTFPNQKPELFAYRSAFGDDKIDFGHSSGVAYQARGTLGGWLQHAFADREYGYAMMEVGTYSSLRVLAALRAENQADRFHSPNDRRFQLAKQELLECFCPSDQEWRNRSVKNGLNVIAQAVKALSTIA